MDEDDPFVAFLDILAADVMDAVARPHRRTLLHIFAEEVFCFEIDRTTKYAEPGQGAEIIADVLREHGAPVPARIGEMTNGQLDTLAFGVRRQVSESVFQILFRDRVFLRVFGLRVAALVKCLPSAEHPDVLRRDGAVRRCGHVPKWMFRGVFFRDQGRCVVCRRDLSGILHPEQVLELDHIVPLAMGGTNDPTNFQLLCEACNAAKLHHSAETSDAYIPFWEPDLAKG